MIFHIKEAREHAGMSQKDLAEKIGVAPTTFHGYESGKHDPKSELLVQIARVCGVSVDFLLGLTNEISPTSAEADPGDKRLDRILDVYEQLNEAGKNDLAKYADHLTYVPEYKNGKMIRIKVQKSVARTKPGESYEDIPSVDEITGTIVTNEEDL